jgi:hypothetical protein
MSHLGRTLLMISLLVSSACATSHPASPPVARRIPDSAPERLAGQREATPEMRAAAAEDRFAAEEDKERREEARAAKAAQQQRVDVVEKNKKGKLPR